VILAATIAGGAIGYAFFWCRQNWDLFVHHSPARVVLIHLSFASDSVFLGTLVGLVIGTAVVVLAEAVGW